MTRTPNWTARMFFWPLLAGFATFLLQWRDVGEDFRRMALVAVLAASVVFVGVCLMRMMSR